MKKLTFLAPLFILFSFTSPAFAISLNDDIELHGFASQSYVYSPDSPYAGTQTEDGSFDFRELGLNLSWNMDEKTRITGQVLSRDFGERADAETGVDFLLLDRVIIQEPTHSFGVRLGRVKNDFGLYNSSRDVPSARPGLEVPQSVYFDSFRDTFLSVDGVNLYGNALGEAGLMEWNVFYGDRDIDSKYMEYYALGGPAEGDYELDKIFGAKLVFEPSQLSGLKLGLSGIRSGLNLNKTQSLQDAQIALSSQFGNLGINPFDGFSAQEQAVLGGHVVQNLNKYVVKNEVDIAFLMASLQYSYDDLLLSAEYMQIHLDNTSEFALIGERSLTSMVEGFYVQAEWFPQSDLVTLIRYEELFLNSDQPVEYLARPYDQTHGYQKAWTVGAKWFINKNWSLGGQIAFNEGTAWAPVYDGMEDNPTSKFWKVYRAAVTFQF